MAITTVSVADHLTLVQGTKGSSMHGISTQHSILSLSLSRSPREAWLAMLLLAASAHAQTGYSTMGLIKKDDSHAVDVFKDWAAREQFLSGDAKRASVKLRREWWDLVRAGKCNWTIVGKHAGMVWHLNPRNAMPGKIRNVSIDCAHWFKDPKLVAQKHAGLNAADRERIQCDILIAVLMHEMTHVNEDIGDLWNDLDVTCNHVTPYDAEVDFWLEKRAHDPLYGSGTMLRDALDKEADEADRAANKNLESWGAL